MKLIERIITAIICSITYAFLLDNGSGYYFAILLVSFCVFLIFGTIFSLVIDNMVKKMNINNSFRRYSISLVFYSIGGIAVIILFAIFQGSLFEISIIPLLFLGVLPSLLYFIVLVLLTTLFKYVRNRLAMK